MVYSYSKLKKIFIKSDRCLCGSQDCKANHRLCSVCHKKIQWGEYVSKANANSKCTWDVYCPKELNHEDLTNLKAVHPWCIKK